jgi:hypothetical protein
LHIVDRINSCRVFAGGYCPHQALMERLYLICQILETKELLRAKALCCHCGECSSRLSLVSALADRLGCSAA